MNYLKKIAIIQFLQGLKISDLSAGMYMQISPTPYLK